MGWCALRRGSSLWLLLASSCTFSPATQMDPFVADDDTGFFAVDGGDSAPADLGTADLGLDAAIDDAGLADAGVPDLGPPDVGFLCGNGRFDPDEECDDGGSVDGDGCSSDCAVEDGYQCFFIPSRCERVPRLSVDEQVDVEEGERLALTVELDRTSLGEVAFSYRTRDAEAMAPSDYAPVQGQGRIPVGATSTVVEVVIEEDLRFEADEAFLFEIDEVLGATTGVARAEVVIEDVPPLTDRGLVVRYFLDEGRRAAMPADVLDAGPLGFDLPVSRDGLGQPLFGTVMGQAGISWQVVGSNGRAGAPLSDAPSFRDRLDDTTEATLEVVVQFTEAANASRFIHVGNDIERGYLTFGATSTDFVLGVLGDEFIRWPIPTSARGQRVVLTLVIDSTRSARFDRAQLFVDGMLLSGADRFLAADLGLPIPAGRTLVLGNRPTGAASIRGDLFYAAIYEVALTAAEVDQHVRALQVSDDGP